jgi:hypothetical protein
MFKQDAKLVAKDGGGNDRLGWAVSLAENYTIAGAPGDDDEKGAAVVFKYSKGKFVV